MVRDELSGFLADMERKEYQSDRGFYLKAFNGYGGFTYDRIGRGTIYIPNATVSIIGGIQPSRIMPFIKEILHGKNDDGLLQRFQMLVWPNEIEEPDWIDRYPNQDAQQDYERLFRSLYDKPLGSPEHSITMRFSADAQEIFCEWWKSFQKKVKKSHFSAPLQAHLLKMPKTIASLALIFELTEGGRFEVSLSSLSMALRWEKYLLSHVKRFYGAVDKLAAERAKLIVERCDCLQDGFTLRDIYKRDWKSLKDNETVKQALDLLCRCNYIREISGDNSSQGGRPTIRYEWHPLVKIHKTSH